MSVDTYRTTALSALVMDRQRCCSAQCVASTAFQMAATPEHGVSTARSPPATRSSTDNHKLLAP
jgi:hypothetical protein